MNDFIKKMLEHGAELDQAVGKIEISMIVNDAEILYRKHLAELNLLNIPVVSNQRELLISFLIDMKECYGMEEKEKAEIYVDNYLTNL